MERITMSIDEKLAREFDVLIGVRGYTSRSEAMRDLLRREVEASRVAQDAHAYCVASLSYVYNHHERDLAERLTEAQHAQHELVVAGTHCPPRSRALPRNADPERADEGSARARRSRAGGARRAPRPDQRHHRRSRRRPRAQGRRLSPPSRPAAPDPAVLTYRMAPRRSEACRASGTGVALGIITKTIPTAALPIEWTGMDDFPTAWAALCGFAFLLGARHGFDADHLATIDGLARYNAASRPRLAQSAGLLFSLGHGAVVIAVAVAAVALAGQLADTGVARRARCGDFRGVPVRPRVRQRARGASGCAWRGRASRRASRDGSSVACSASTVRGAWRASARCSRSRSIRSRRQR